MTLPPELRRSRHIRRQILTMLIETYRAVPGLAIAVEELLDTVARGGGPLGFATAEVRAELLDLAHDDLVEIDQLRVRITTTGRDFLRAGCPWEQVDEFTGGQK